MNINLNHARFNIRKVNNQLFGIFVSYRAVTFCIRKGVLHELKPIFMKIVKNRTLLSPYIAYYIKTEEIA